MDVIITAEALVNPTEDPSKIERALQRIFPGAPSERTSTPEDMLTLKVHGNGLEFLTTLRNLIKQERIRSAARAILLNRTESRRIQFYLNKQVAFVGRVSFCEPVGESPLGPIAVKIECDDPQMVIDFLTAIPSRNARWRGHGST